MTWSRETDEHEAREQLTSFLDAGGNLVDTAAGYADGGSEELLGSLVGTVVPRDDVVIATKAGISRRTGDRVLDTSRGNLLSTLDASLKRLGVDHVDLWQVHVWTNETPVEETLAALDFAVSTGRTAYAGISNYTGWQTGAGGHVAARGAGPDPPGLDPGRVLPGQPEGRDRGPAGRERPRARGAPVVAARSRRADRQVPDGHPVGLPRRHQGLRELRGRLPRRPRSRDRRGDREGRRRARLDAAAGGPGLGPGPSWRDGPDRRRQDVRTAQGRARDRGQVAAGGDRLGAR